MSCLHRLRRGTAAGFALATVAMLGLADSAQGQRSLHRETLDVRDGTQVEWVSVFEPLPPSGYAPMRVVVTNGQESARRWTFDVLSQQKQFRSNHSQRSRFQLEVPARSTQTATLLVPLIVAYGDHAVIGRNHHELSVGLEVEGFPRRDFSDHQERVRGFPAIALSQALANGNHDRLKDEVEQRMKGSSPAHSGNKWFGSRFEPDDLAEDWRGLSGFDVLMITHPEWQRLSSAQRLACLHWIRLGGQLDVYATTALTPAALGMPLERTDRLGLGRVQVLIWDGRVLDSEKTVARLWGRSSWRKSLAEDHSFSSGTKMTMKPQWGLLASLGERDFRSWQVITLLVLFGLLVGPVNLYVLAPPGKRHKLFITTPVLSLAASALMIGLIVFQDGLGGHGKRLVVIELVPEEATAYVTQQQASRAGVLLGSGFEMKTPAVIEPLALPDSPWVKVKSTPMPPSVNLTQDGRWHGGHYFQSRSEQGQSVRAVLSTRARLELKQGRAPGAAPEIISALGFSIDQLFYLDAEAKLWKARQPLATGQSVVLEAADAQAVSQLWKEMRDLAGGSTQESLTRLQKDDLPRGGFVATARRAPDFTLSTLDSIRWEEDHVVLFGPLVSP